MSGRRATAHLRRIAWLIAIVAPLAIMAVWVSRGVTVPSFGEVRSRYAPSEAYLLDRHDQLLQSSRINLKVRRLDWVALPDISPALIAAIIDAEDRRFFEHHGVDWRAVIPAMKSNLIDGRRRGASTITMQLASLLTGNGRSGGVMQNLRRKLMEVRAAHAIESRWTKTQVIEAYLNLVQFRGDLTGIAAASQMLAGKSPSGLSQNESRVLAALLPDPGAAAERVALRACSRAGLQSSARECVDLRQIAARLLQRVDSHQASPALAPQLAAVMLKSPGERVRTTLDIAIQRYSQDVLAQHLAELRDHNVRDGAALVIDNKSGDVLAYVASGGPFSSASQVDGVRAKRQAGSTLKPFLYELSLERRYLTAASLLEDSPLNLDTGSGAYIPQDYDHEFKGAVSVRTALGSSLNVPAVRALIIVGVEAFRDRLNSLGYAGIVEDGAYYGYSLALGSAEVSLWEQAQAYRALARGGRFSPLRIRTDEARAEDRFPMAAGASFIVGDIMSDPIARSATFGLNSHLNTPFWSAAKTGTSKDMRDNWCVGFSSDFTVAVWVGNFEGDAMHDVSGVTGAAPIWHDIMIALHQDIAVSPPPPPPGVLALQVRFSPAVEPERREWYLNGTENSRVTGLPKDARIARIISPANGMIIAIDPDIPPRSQRVPITVQGVAPGMSLELNDESLGSASQQILWIPVAGAQRLELKDGNGASVDRVLFTVR
jgi:penicillin-binding protein 1C